MQRMLDVALGGVGLVASSPFLALAALAIKLEDGGPVLYRQSRAGRDGGDFELLKPRAGGAGGGVGGGDRWVAGRGPTLRCQVEQYDGRRRGRLEVKPGITGWAQIHGRASLPWDERIQRDGWHLEGRPAWGALPNLAR